jgi:L-ascorbate metabolism protein UlaG (beta-lactamase superfamily)
MGHYLKSNLVIEPLVDRWYAWSHLISPATAAMNIVGRHLKIMNSYIQAPQIHEAAVKNPKMKGGPFMDLGGGKVDKVKQLRDTTMGNQKDSIELCMAIKELDKLLKNNAKGYSLEPLYEKVPEALKGYVELFYDLNNNPSFRFFESLLYNSKYYKVSSQSLALWLTNNDERPFCLSTPRVDDDNILHLDIPFAHPGIDALSKMKRIPGSVDKIAEVLNIQDSDKELFSTFFTTTAPEPYQEYKGDKIRMRYFGHACILVETPQVSVLLDPIISYYGYQTDVSRFSDIHLPDKIDYLLITHNHQDHILLETLLPLRHKIKNLVIPRSGSSSLQDPSLKLMFENLGFENIVEVEEMESIRFADCTITGIPFIGEHSDLNIQTKLCYHVQIEDCTMMFVADSCNVESKLYEHIHAIKGDIDVLFLGMECDGAPLTWLYGPLLTEELARDKDQSRRLAGSNFERGRSLVDIFKPTEVYVYAMGQEPWLEFISSIKYTDESNPIIASNNLIKYCDSKNITAERLFGEKELLYSRKKETQMTSAF